MQKLLAAGVMFLVLTDACRHNDGTGEPARSKSESVDAGGPSSPNGVDTDTGEPIGPLSQQPGGAGGLGGFGGSGGAGGGPSVGGTGARPGPPVIGGKP